MNGVMPIGDFIKPQPRGQVTIPGKLRKRLAITTDTVLNIFEDGGVIIMVPVVPTPVVIISDKEWRKAARETEKLKRNNTDWTTKDFSVAKYMEAVRYNPLEKLRSKRIREQW